MARTTSLGELDPGYCPAGADGSTKYKAYPTYDLACPIIDHIDGVTHALRANEYSARHEQYQWFLTKLGLPKIEIFDFRSAQSSYQR
jgi:glutamyl-tRNA synthetase